MLFKIDVVILTVKHKRRIFEEPLLAQLFFITLKLINFNNLLLIFYQ